MPARPRLTKASKALKENECVTKTGKQNHRGANVKPVRKVLGDKTNSASDDNTSILKDENPQKKLISKKSTQDKTEQNDFRPRRPRKLPSRYKENIALNNLSNSKETPPTKQATKTVSVKRKVGTVKTKISSDKIKNSLKNKSSVISPLKTASRKLDDSLVHNRPKRISRLPSKFNDHCISPTKLLPVQPINTSTPLANKTKKFNKELIVTVSQIKTPESKIVSKQNTIKNYFNSSSKTIADSNNNAKKSKTNKFSLKTSPVNIPITNPGTKLNKNSSERKNSLKRDSSKLDIYEFTFDPKEEPPAKKKKKRTVTKKPSKPKTVTFKSNYDKNLAKALADLKNAMLEKAKSVNIKDKTNAIVLPEKYNYDQKKEVSVNQNLDLSEDCLNNKNYNSVRVEDIAMDIHEDDINYSPVNSPCRPLTPAHDTSKPKNIIQELSFFEDHPVASSSMNVSNNPLASPWRAEYGNLPIKWPINSYVKPNMTPAFESSFINFNEKKKHVYTNLLADSHDPLPEIVDSPTLKQTSIMSFIKEVVDKHESRKKSKLTPVKANSLFEEPDASVAQTPKKQCEINENVSPVKNDSNLLKETTGPDSDIQNEKSNDKYFGFDQSEDRENISPKKKNKARLLKTTSRGVLQELNAQKGPMRVNIPLSKLKPVQNVVTKVLPQVPDTDVTEPSLPQNLENVDTDSVHLFEDIEIVHHLKPTRKSYGKPKKVAFAKDTSTNSDSSPLSDLDHASSDEDLDDSSFRLPSIKPSKVTKKKKTNKQKLSKKEEKEIETWAAGFNSMCEDVDQFDLLVE